MHSFRKAKQPGPITRLLSCTEEEKRRCKGMGLAPTFEVPSMSRHPKTGDWYPAINKPAGVVHWLKHSKDAENVDWVVILDAYMIIRGPVIPWELGAEKGKPIAAYYGYLVGCDNLLAQLHTKHPELCDKVGGLLAMHIDDLRALAPMWLLKTEIATTTTSDKHESERRHPKIQTLFSTECSPYFDWQTVGLLHSFHVSGQPGNITRLLSCTDEDLKKYRGHDLAPTHYVPSMSRHPLTGDWSCNQ